MYLTQRAPSTKKVMAAKAKLPVEGQSAAALPAQGKEKKKRAVPRPPTNAVRSFQYKTYQHSRRTIFEVSIQPIWIRYPYFVKSEQEQTQVSYF